MQFALDFDLRAFLKVGGPLAELVPADDSMPLGACVVFAGFLHLLAHARRDGKAGVGSSVQGVACLSVLAEKPNESDSILAKHVFVFLSCPIRRGDPVRRGPLSRQARQFFGGAPGQIVCVVSKGAAGNLAGKPKPLRARTVERSRRARELPLKPSLTVRC